MIPLISRSNPRARKINKFLFERSVNEHVCRIEKTIKVRPLRRRQFLQQKPSEGNYGEALFAHTLRHDCNCVSLRKRFSTEKGHTFYSGAQ